MSRGSIRTKHLVGKGLEHVNINIVYSKHDGLNGLLVQLGFRIF
jgi:hypothetical protein